MTTWDSRLILTTDQMYRADQLAMMAGIPGIDLMENAGAAVAAGARRLAKECGGGRILILCGPGNNGGDGFVAARHLAQTGLEVTLGLLGERAALKGDAAHHAGLWDGPVLDLGDSSAKASWREPLHKASIVVDALFGAGLDRPLEGAAAEIIEAVRKRGAPVLAVDVPSGLNGNSGTVEGGLVLPAKRCITFFRKKCGHVLEPGRSLCGPVEVADIGIPESVLGEIDARCWENDPLLTFGEIPARGALSHKYRFGHVVVAGGQHMSGAARLAARAALRVGAGLVSLAVPRQSLPTYALTGASFILLPCDDDESFLSLLEDPRRNSLVIGPGLGTNDRTRNFAVAALESERALVLDADGLTVFEDDPQTLCQLLTEQAVITPHEGEFARLFPDLSGDKLERAKAAAERCGACVVLKGSDSIVAAPDGRAMINNAPANLATAGSGDVLAGLIAGLLAMGMEPFAASAAACALHGLAAEQVGRGLISEDLPEQLPAVFAVLEGRTKD